jgi:threonine aldolase
MYIDLRSDSVTRPTPKMRRAMAEAEVGYDVFREDPTVNRLEALAAEMTGKEKGLFVPTGTMGNQLAILAFTSRGDEIILSADSHIPNAETGAASVLAGVGYRSVFTPDGILRPADIEEAVRPDFVNKPRTGMVCLENALGRGTALPLDLMEAAYSTARKHKLPVHTDGARVFNAAHALGTTVDQIARFTDSLVIHLSKGLCAPVGSVLLGPGDFIERARRYRHMLGGGWSQAGILAAAGIVALEDMVDRLAEDHEHARYLREQLSALPGIAVDYTRADINMVFFTIENEALRDRLRACMLEKNIRISGHKNGVFRFVVHNDVSVEDIGDVVSAMQMLI